MLIRFALLNDKLQLKFRTNRIALVGSKPGTAVGTGPGHPQQQQQQLTATNPLQSVCNCGMRTTTQSHLKAMTHSHSKAELCVAKAKLR